MAERPPMTPASGAAIREEQLELLFALSPLSIITSPLAAAVLSMAIWEVVDHSLAIAWVGVLVVVAVLRLSVFVAHKMRRDALPMRQWERVFNWSLLLAGLVWGIGGWLLLPEGLAYRAIVLFFLMGMASAASAVYAIHGGGVMPTILALVLPTTVDFLLQDSRPQQLMGRGRTLPRLRQSFLGGHQPIRRALPHAVARPPNSQGSRRDACSDRFSDRDEQSALLLSTVRNAVQAGPAVRAGTGGHHARYRPVQEDQRRPRSRDRGRSAQEPVADRHRHV